MSYLSRIGGIRMRIEALTDLVAGFLLVALTFYNIKNVKRLDKLEERLLEKDLEQKKPKDNKDNSLNDE